MAPSATPYLAGYPGLVTYNCGFLSAPGEYEERGSMRRMPPSSMAPAGACLPHHTAPHKWVLIYESAEELPLRRGAHNQVNFRNQYAFESIR
ncbi:hypothetical protein R70211_02221 [Paraburkholderia domus]|uniref:Uncharacterized protein n=1 Tax=Paraburkholderia domus TaxID=2793075 RepID=A0A9N8QU31_9BURK|nr:hypothetical protein R70211_02221 [Paraburkholderia domus]